MGAKGSSTAVRMWMARKATASNEALRCRVAVTKRGQRAGAQRWTWLMPRAMTRVSRTNETRPVDRVRYHRAWVVPLVVTAPITTSPPPRRPDRPVVPRSSSAGQPATAEMRPLDDTRRAGRHRASSQAGASSPSTMAAVEATLASTQEPAATVAVRQPGRTGPPVRGSSRWCSSTPPRCQRRTVVPDVARPPPARVTVWPARSSRTA